MDTRPNETLVAEVKEGNISAFETLVRRYQDKLMSFVFRYVRDWGAAEEIVQDTLFAVYRSIDHIDTKQKFSSYVYAAAKNTAISYLRRVRPKTISDINEVADEEDLIEDRLLKAEQTQEVRYALSKLEDKYRNVVKFFYFEGLSYEEISHKLKVPLNTVRTWLRRAKKELAQSL